MRDFTAIINRELLAEHLLFMLVQVTGRRHRDGLEIPENGLNRENQSRRMHPGLEGKFLKITDLLCADGRQPFNHDDFLIRGELEDLLGEE